jgi:hypothetical protein
MVEPLRPEIAHCHATRYRIASSGAVAVPELVDGWHATPTLRSGIIVTFGILLWYAENAGTALSREDRVMARRHLIRGAGAEEAWIRQGFIEAAEWTHDPVWIPLVRRVDPASPVARRLEGEHRVRSAAELLMALEELWAALCEEGWVVDAGLCRSTQLGFQTAQLAIDRSDHRTTRAVLAAMGVNVSGARGRGVRAEAHELFKSGIQAVEGALGR